MYSTRPVGSCFKRTRRSVRQSFSLETTCHRPQVPARNGFRGPGGNRTCLAMYSTTAVECVSCPDEGCSQRTYEVLQQSIGGVFCQKTDEVVARGLRALPLSYGAAVVSSAGGNRTHNHGFRSMYSDPAVGLFSTPNEGLTETVTFVKCSPDRQLGFSCLTRRGFAQSSDPKGLLLSGSGGI
jgi:hypothetical protein